MDTILTDDHVAELLAKEANDCSLRYSTMGLDAYSSSRPTSKAKPNTRFLRNIIKETKSHNEALLAKEAAESQARLDSLAEAKAKEERKRRPAAQDLRRRQLGTITATLQGKKRKLAEGDDEGHASRKRDLWKSSSEGQDRKNLKADRSVTEEPQRDRHRGRDRDRETERRHRKVDRSLSPDDGNVYRRGSRPNRSRSPGYKERKHRHSHRHSHRYRDRSPSDDDEAGTDRRSPPRSARPSHRHRDREQDDDTHTSSSRKQHRHKRREEEEEEADRRSKPDTDSDPLEDIIGPLPPSSSSSHQIRPRGRGAASGPSAMDSRFSATYDPKSDIQPDSDLEGDDWADSLEALRDREKWRQQGADRLRAAGFTEEQIKGWEKNNGREKSVEDVRWAKKGEGREWDRGKVAGG